MNRKIILVSLVLVLGILSAVVYASSVNLIVWMSSPASTTPVPEGLLIVDGLVQHSLNLTLEDLVAMPRTTVNAALYCVDRSNSPLAEGNWTGVRLGSILEEAKVTPNATKIAFYAEDGFSTDLTVEAANRKDIIIAYERNGQKLPEKLRLVVPGEWGYKWISNLNHIKLVEYDFKGFWEMRGYPDNAEIPTKP